MSLCSSFTVNVLILSSVIFVEKRSCGLNRPVVNGSIKNIISSNISDAIQLLHVIVYGGLCEYGRIASMINPHSGHIACIFSAFNGLPNTSASIVLFGIPDKVSTLA